MNKSFLSISSGVSSKVKSALIAAAVVAMTATPVAQAQTPKEISVWLHKAGSSDLYVKLLDEFNASQTQYKAVTLVGAGSTSGGSSYDDAVKAAAAANELPCVLDVDGPNMPNYAWGGFLQSIEEYATEEYRKDFLASTIDQGTYNGTLYAIGPSDSGLGLVSRRSVLESVGARIPKGIEDPWTLEEFNKVLTDLKATGKFKYVFDTQIAGASEFYTWAFSPILQSFGGDLIDRTDYQSAEGVLNGPEAVAALTWIQNLYTSGLATLTPPTPNNDFVDGVAAIGYYPSWKFGAYNTAFGDDLVILPQPNYGKGAVTGLGSWQFAITKNCSDPAGAWAVIDYLVSPEANKSVTDVTGSLPTRLSVAAQNPNWGPNGKMYILQQQLEKGVGRPRPITPAYPVITVAFSKAMDDIIKGADVQDSLDKAVETIDENIKENKGYPVQ